MTHAAVAAEVHQALDVHRDFTTQVAFDNEAADFVTQLFHVGLGQILDLPRAHDAGSVANLLSTRTADPIDGGQRDLGMLVIGNVYPSNTGHPSTPKRETLNSNRLG